MLNSMPNKVSSKYLQMQLHLYVSIDLNLTGVAYSTIQKLSPSYHKCCLHDNCFIAPPKTVLMDWHFEVLMCEFDELSLHQRIDGAHKVITN